MSERSSIHALHTRRFRRMFHNTHHSISARPQRGTDNTTTSNTITKHCGQLNSRWDPGRGILFNSGCSNASYSSQTDRLFTAASSLSGIKMGFRVQCKGDSASFHDSLREYRIPSFSFWRLFWVLGTTRLCRFINLVYFSQILEGGNRLFFQPMLAAVAVDRCLNFLLPAHNIGGALLEFRLGGLARIFFFFFFIKQKLWNILAF